MADPAQSLKNFVSAVKCLSVGENIKQANDWLMNFKTLDDAWAVTVQCLGQTAIPGMGADDMEMLHFQAANMVKDKIRKSGDSLAPPARQQLRQRLVQLIKVFHSQRKPKTALQLCIALANLAVVDDSWNDVIVYCANGFSAVDQREMLLDVLRYFPEQLHRHDRHTISLQRMENLRGELKKYSPHVLKLIQHSLTVPALVQNERPLKVRDAKICIRSTTERERLTLLSYF